MSVSLNNGFHLMGNFQNREFIMFYAHYLLRVDNLGVKVDGRMCHLSRLMSRTLQTYVLRLA